MSQNNATSSYLVRQSIARFFGLADFSVLLSWWHQILACNSAEKYCKNVSSKNCAMYLFKLWKDFLPEDSKLFLEFFKNMRNPRTEIFASNTAHFHFFQFQKLIWSLKEFPDDYQAINKSIISFENKILLKFPIFGFGLSLFFLSFDSNGSNFLISAYEINVVCMSSDDLLIWWNFGFWSTIICYCLLSPEKKCDWSTFLLDQ